MRKLRNFILSNAAVFVMIAAVAGADARSVFVLHEPKVPAKLRKE